MTFSENQVRQLYVATQAQVAVTPGVKVGTLKAKNDKNHEYIWFEYMGAGGITASDKIKVSNIVSAKSLKSEAMDIPLNRHKLSLDENVNGGMPVSGQDYILTLAFRQYVGISDEDQYFKLGMVHATKGMTVDTFYKTLAISLAKNLSREVNKLAKIYLHSSDATSGKFNSEGFIEVAHTMKVDGGSQTPSENQWYDGSVINKNIDYIVIEETEQPWVRGKFAVGKIPFEVIPDTITVEGDEIIWGTVTKEAPKNKIGSGKIIADLEYFCMGERGDQYRGMGYPNDIHTEYLVDANKKYDVLDITYFYAGDNEDIQKSQKTITIVADNSSANTLIKNIISDVNTATDNKPSVIQNPEKY